MGKLTKELANRDLGLTPYHFSGNKIIIDKKWKDYFQQHQYILRGFIQWHLLRFLQKNNPSVVGLSYKMDKPVIRDLKFARQYWEKYVEHHNIKCIYNGDKIEKQQISLDHFIPWSYVAHDLIWNIVPTTRSTNSMKSNQLPDIGVYFEKYCKLQYDALMFHLTNSPTIIIEDFFHLLGIEKIEKISYEIFREKLSIETRNSFRNATNLGFRLGTF